MPKRVQTRPIKYTCTRRARLCRRFFVATISSLPKLDPRLSSLSVSGRLCIRLCCRLLLPIYCETFCGTPSSVHVLLYIAFLLDLSPLRTPRDSPLLVLRRRYSRSHRPLPLARTHHASPLLNSALYSHFYPSLAHLPQSASARPPLPLSRSLSRTSSQTRTTSRTPPPRSL